jgi:hypothetical protein
MGKERVSEGLAAGQALHWIENCGDVKINPGCLNERFLHVPCMKVVLVLCKQN